MKPTPSSPITPPSVQSAFDNIWGSKAPAPGAPKSSRADEIRALPAAGQGGGDQSQKGGFFAPVDYSAATKGGVSGIWNDLKNLKASDLPAVAGAGLYGGAQAAAQIPVNVAKGAYNIGKGIVNQPMNTVKDIGNIASGSKELFDIEYGKGGGGTKGLLQDLMSGVSQVSKPVVDKISQIISNPASTLNDIHNLSVSHPLETALTVKMLFDQAQKMTAPTGSKEIPNPEYGLEQQNSQTAQQMENTDLLKTGDKVLSGNDLSGIHAEEQGITAEANQPIPKTLTVPNEPGALNRGLNAVDKGVSAVGQTVTKPVGNALQAIGKGLGNAAAQTLGVSTGAGASSIKQAAGGSEAFTKAMRGQSNPEDVVSSVQDAVQSIKDTRGEAYRAQLAKLGEDTTTHDISPVMDSLDKQMKNFNIKVTDDGQLDFSRSSIANNGSARADIQGVYDTLKDWGSQPGDRTGVGLDTLKKQLGDFYSPSGSARAFVQGVKGSVSDILQNEVEGYSDMTKKYQTASNLLDDIKSATSAGGTAKSDTIFTKLTSAMKGDKEFRLDVLNQLQEGSGDPTLMDKIAGTNMQGLIPKGLVGKGVDVGEGLSILAGHFNPAMIPAILATSPRVVGEFVRALGLGTQKATQFAGIVKNLGVISPDVLGKIVVQQSLPTGSPQESLK